MDGFWRRLKRRKLVQWALAYIAAAFAFIQVLDVVVQRFGWPDRVEKLIILALAVGFLVMLVLAWYHGEKGAQRIGGGELLIIALLLAIGGGALWAYTRTPATAAAKPVPSAIAAASSSASKPFDPPADSLVVLPFTNLGGDPKQQYFSDGITEELTNSLGQNPALTVIAWDTASKYRNSHESPRAIGKALNVANLLHGSIERENGRVRVITELVNTRTGAQIWSSQYDDSLSNIFQVQDKISASISGALKVKFATANTQRTVNPQAYDLVQQANAIAGLDAVSDDKARALLEQAVALDPDYAQAHAALAGVWMDSPQFSKLSLKDALPKVRAEANRALQLDPRNVAAISVLARADAAEGNFVKARAGYEHALAIDPSNASVHMNYGNVLSPKLALAQYLEAGQLDPDNGATLDNLAVAYLDLGQYAQALPPMRKLQRRLPHNADVALAVAQIYGLLHRNEDAVKAFDLASPGTALGKATVAAGRLTYQSLLDPKLRPQALAALDALRQRPDLTPFTQADVIQLYLVLGAKRTALELLPNSCASIPVGCSDLSVNPLWLPLRGDPRFEALVKKYDTTAQPPASASPSP